MLTARYGKPYNPTRKRKRAGVGSKAKLWHVSEQGAGNCRHRFDLVVERNRHQEG